jgi:hypothetical protein
MNETYKAWLAGFFDGEGTVCFCHNHNRDYARVCLYQKDQLDLLLDIRDIYGGSVRFIKSGYSKGVHVLSLERKTNVVAFLTDIIPYLRVKRRKAELMLAYCSINVGCNQHGFAEQKARRAEIRDEFRSLHGVAGSPGQ